MFSLLHLLSLQVFFSCLLSLYGVYWLKCAKDGLFLIGNILKDTFQYELDLVNVSFNGKVVNFLRISLVSWASVFSVPG